MKSPILLVCALVAAMSMPALAETTTNTKAETAATEKAAKVAKMKAAQEARINKFMESTKTSNPALYSELTALQEKDPAAFKAKVRTLMRQNRKENAAKAKKKNKKEAQN